MRTRPAHIEPACPYCDAGHNPDIRCREQPESVRFQLVQTAARIKTRAAQRIFDASGQLIAVRQVIREE